MIFLIFLIFILYNSKEMCLPLSDKKPEEQPSTIPLPPVIQYPIQVPIPAQPKPVAIVLPTVKKPTIQLVAKPVPLPEEEEQKSVHAPVAEVAPVVHITPAVHHHHQEQHTSRPLIQIHRTASK
jgi:hypothetical protein